MRGPSKDAAPESGYSLSLSIFYLSRDGRSAWKPAVLPHLVLCVSDGRGSPVLVALYQSGLVVSLC